MSQNSNKKVSKETYKSFLKINGTHPWREVSPDAYVDYRVRCLKGAKVAYFNFDLAAEMGLISKSHPKSMNKELEKMILQTFAVQIINEYEITKNISYLSKDIKSQPYMATRYLQLQHKNKQGKTSGDGRSIWMGKIDGPKMSYDLSSCGTGVTCLAPGAQETDVKLKTGSKEVGYGSGLADLSEMLDAAIYSEIFSQRGYPSERMLAVIQVEGSRAIGVRAAPNLIRPAHIFRFLKLGKISETKKALDCFLERQIKNGEIKSSLKNPKRYQKCLSYITNKFAYLAALLEEEYIFHWLDWDGDNVLADSSILDYGSVRQFYLCHDQYRYDDGPRWSTHLREQKNKAAYIIQSFAQLFDAVENKEKRAIEQFSKAPALLEYKELFQKHSMQLFLQSLGFNELQIQFLRNIQAPKVLKLFKAFKKLEKRKSQKHFHQTADGKNKLPLLDARMLKRNTAALYAGYKNSKNKENWLQMTLRDLLWPSYRKKQFLENRNIKSDFVNYFKCFGTVLNGLNGFHSKGQEEQSLDVIIKTAEEKHRRPILTGDALSLITQQVLNWRKGTKKAVDIQKAVEYIISRFGESNESLSLSAKREEQIETIYRTYLATP